eukprot:TRINITY_DN65243_c0_g1_i1.p2 TRINITY_DN65243_c0_g1~~TRINITY_DN65243_c0_g1_i1.p2  ORF type:complete len:174 (+),score=37.30 TRINITY_DN65243_c0_g1_i1:179-700(+)
MPSAKLSNQSALDAMLVVSRQELHKHKYSRRGDTWIALHGLVYDVTAYLPDHPGGGDLVEIVGGEDATDKFEEAAHSARSRKELRNVRLKGVLEGCEDLVANLIARGWHEGRGIPHPAMLAVSSEEVEDSGNVKQRLLKRPLVIFALFAFVSGGAVVGFARAFRLRTLRKISP